MPSLRTFLLFGIIVVLGIYSLGLKETRNNILKPAARINNATAINQPAKITIPQYPKERISYTVKMGSINLGRAKFSFIGQPEINGTVLNEMVMETKLTRFNDVDRIYSDPVTLLPIKVERSISKLFSQERIIEEYDQKKFKVVINKTSGSRHEKNVIQKEGVIHNVVLLPHYVRRIKDLDIGKTITANLPTLKLELKLVDSKNVKVPAGTFKAYHFESIPKKIEIWISQDERKIPLKIESIGPLGYSMLMNEYSVETDKDPAKDPVQQANSTLNSTQP